MAVGFLSDQWRIYIETNGGSASWVGINEIEMFGDDPNTDLCEGGTAIASKSSWGSPASAFNNTTAGNDTWGAASPPTDQWIGYQFAEPVNIQSMTISIPRAGLLGSFTGLGIWRIEAYVDGAWVVVKRFDDLPLPNDSVTTVAASAPYTNDHYFAAGSLGVDARDRLVYALDTTTLAPVGAGTSDKVGDYYFAVTQGTESYHIMVTDPNGKYLPVHMENLPVTIVEVTE